MNIYMDQFNNIEKNREITEESENKKPFIKTSEQRSMFIFKTIIYKLVRDGELNEQEKEIVDRIVEEKDYSE